MSIKNSVADSGKGKGLLQEIEKLRNECLNLEELYRINKENGHFSKYKAYHEKLEKTIERLNNRIALLQGQSVKIESAASPVSFSVLKNVDSEIREEFENRIELLYKGMELANKICEYDNSVLYLLLYRQAGDVMNLLSKIPVVKQYYGEESSRYHFVKSSDREAKSAFKKQKTIKRIIAITKPDNLGVVRLFSQYLDGIHILKYRELQALAKYALSPCAIHQNIVCEADAMRIMGGRNETDEGQWCRIKMFGGVLDIERDLCIPHEMFKPKFRPNIGEETKQLANELVEQLKIDESNTVILCPVSKFSSMLDLSVWDSFAEYLLSQNKVVFTFNHIDNTIVKNTKILKTDVDILACLSTIGCKIIGVHGSDMDVVNAVAPKNLVCLSVIKNEKDKEYAKARKVTDEINRMPNGAVYLRIENFDKDYVVDLLKNIEIKKG